MYYSLNEYLKTTFGTKVYKLSLNGGMTCPNRDGTKGSGGCIFCSDEGSGEFSQKFTDIYTQIENAKLLVKSKSKSGKYIAYFQSYTNTYAPIKHLENIYAQAINHKDIVALSIATRPDCINDDVIILLDKLNKIKPIFVELGLQTSNEKTATYINRAYKNIEYVNACKSLKSININVVTHIILGLPFESTQDMLNTVSFACSNNTDGLKFHLLHVLKGTKLEIDYNNNLFKTLSLEEYIHILCECLKNVPSNVVIHRLTGDGPKRILISPLWSGDKKRVLNSINKALLNINQGQNIKE